MPRRRWLRRTVIVIVIVSSLFGMAVGFGYANRLDLAKWALIQGLQTLGLTEIEATLTELSLDGATLENVRLAPCGPAATRLRISYTPGGLLSGRVDDIVVSGFASEIRLREDGTFSYGMDDLGSTDSNGGLVATVVDLLGSFKHITLQDGTIRLTDTSGETLLKAAISFRVRYMAADSLSSLVFENAVVAISDQARDIQGFRLETASTFVATGNLTFVPDEGANPIDGDQTNSPSWRPLIDITATAAETLRVETPAGQVSANAPTFRLHNDEAEENQPLTISIKTEALDMDFGAARSIHLDFCPFSADVIARVSGSLIRLPGEHADRSGVARPIVVNATLSERDDTEYHLDMTATAGGGAFLLTGSGTVSHDASTGKIQLIGKPASFGRGNLTAPDLHGVLGDWISLSGGQISLRGDLNWSDTGFNPDFGILLKDVSGDLDGLTIQGLNTVVRLTQFSPLGGPSQDAALGVLDIGVPLTEGVARYRFAGDGSLMVETLRCTFAGGTISARQVRVPLTGGRIRTSLTVEQLSLPALSDMLALDGFHAVGTLSGKIPVSFYAPEGLILQNAYLDSNGRGEIHYKTDTTPAGLDAGSQSSVNLLLKAVENFHFTSLGVTLNGQIENDLKLGVSIKGSNPDLYDGYPIELNANISGAVLDLIRKNVHTYQLPSRIRDNLNDFLSSLGESD